MLGVVLWSDQAERKAVIWCEDHGQLAFYGSCNHSAATPDHLDEGDLIQFDLCEHENLRLARNPRRIAQQYCSDLGDVLSAATKMKSEIEAERDAPNADAIPTVEASNVAQSADLICLAAARSRKQAKDHVAA